jgi:hypothetical protein
MSCARGTTDQESALFVGSGRPVRVHEGCPILSGIFTEAGVQRLDAFMGHKGFTLKYDLAISPKGAMPTWTPKRERYIVRAYDIPAAWTDLSAEEKGLGYPEDPP